MAVIGTPAGRARAERLERIWKERPGVLGWLTTTDHKRIGLLYLFASMAFFGAGGVEALLVRTQLITPDNGLLGPEAYNEIFTMHGVTMIFLFVIPISTGAFGNYLLPLQIGARDMAFPRMNALSFWIFAASGIFMYVSVFIGSAPDAGWFDYVPLASKAFSPGPNIDFYCLGIIFNSISTTAAAVNFIVTIFKHRAPGMSLNRMPLFCFAILAVSFALIFALPPLSVATGFLELDRRVGTHFYDIAAGGDPLMWQHLFWIFGHPEVYIIILPAFGIATSIIPTFCRRRMVAFPLVAVAEILVAFIGFGVWAHHMFAVGLPTATTVYFAAASLIVVIPSGIQLFAWLTTIATGKPTFQTPLLFIVGFIVFFIIGGLSGVMFAAIPFDQQTTDTYFVVAHFHFVIFGAAVFPLLGGLYYWFPKVTGRLYHEGVGKVSFWMTFVGSAVTFFPMHIVGLLGMPRRTYTYPPGMGWSGLNLLETLGSYVLAAGLILIVVNLAVSLRRGAPAGNDPFDGATLEWATTSPPPEYNFTVIPAISSPYPMWDARDREEDVRRVERGELVLDTGHETPATTVVDAELDEVLDMPSESPWPIVLAGFLGLVFTFLLTGHLVTALVFGGCCAAALAAWHRSEPEHTAQRRRSAPSGWWGMGLFLATETALFGTLIGSYFYLRFTSPQWPQGGIAAPSAALPLALTAGLLLSCLPMMGASRAAARGRGRAAFWLVALAFAMQSGYLAVQIVSYLDDLHTFHPDANAYASIYFTLLGAHHAHVLVGLLLDVWLLARLVRGLTAYRAIAVRAVALYWYVVALIGVAVVLTQVSPS
ncbi:MAG TPA: cytochrome c oxidase subunit I [Solirubrobacteraceae bacterium]